MATTMQGKLLERDLRSLEELAELLNTAIDDKIKRVVTDVKDWLCQDVTTDVRQPYENIKQVTESAIAFVTDICQQIEDGWQANVTEKVSAESGIRRSKKSSKASAELSDTRIKMMENKMTSLESKYSQIESKYSLTESKYSQIESKYSQIESKCSQIESKYSLIESKYSLEVSTYSQLADDVHNKFETIDGTLTEMTSSMKSQVLKHTEKVEDIDKRLNSVEETQKTMTETVQKPSSELTAFGKKSDSPDVGFTASDPWGYEPVEGRTVTGYVDVRGNKHLSFRPDTGIFTAPVKGLYAVGVRQWQLDSGKIVMYVKKTSQSCTSTAAATAQAEREKRICRTETQGDDTGDFNLTLTEMEVGDTLRVEPITVRENPILYYQSTFSVFLISS